MAWKAFPETGASAPQKLSFFQSSTTVIPPLVTGSHTTLKTTGVPGKMASGKITSRTTRPTATGRRSSAPIRDKRRSSKWPTLPGATTIPPNTKAGSLHGNRIPDPQTRGIGKEKIFNGSGNAMAALRAHLHKSPPGHDIHIEMNRWRGNATFPLRELKLQGTVKWNRHVGPLDMKAWNMITAANAWSSAPPVKRQYIRRLPDRNAGIDVLPVCVTGYLCLFVGCFFLRCVQIYLFFILAHYSTQL